MTKATLGRKGFVWLTLPPLKEVKTEQEPGPGADTKIMEGCCIMASSQQDHHLICDVTQHGLVHPPSITNLENRLEMDLMEAFSVN